MARLYFYVGPEEIRTRAVGASPGMVIASAHDVENWLLVTAQRPNPDGLYVVTFVVDEQGNLRIADRGSEHVACAGGGPVLSAGEMFFRRSSDGAAVEEVSNHSTGYCPEPESWPSVVAALDRIGIRHPGRFTQEIVFRRCPSCGQRNVVKDGWFACGVCGAVLPERWNFGETP